MIFLLEQGGYSLKNYGDVAMLEVVVERLIAHDPDAHVYVVTDAPERLRGVLPSCHPLTPNTLRFIYERGSLFGRIACVMAWVDRLERLIRDHFFPIYLKLLIARRSLRGPPLGKEEKEWVDVMWRVDAVICTGGGYINDVWSDFVQRAHLRTLMVAQRLGKKTAMFGQGIGPLTESSLVQSFALVAKRLDMLTLREPIASLRNCEAAGVSRLEVCGDDALTLSVRRSVAKPAGMLGLNIRRSNYAGIPDELFSLFPELVSTLCSDYALTPRIIPISAHIEENDIVNTAPFISEDKERKEAIRSAKAIEGVEGLLDHLSLCNLTITGSYHAAVFSLGLGIPVIGLVASDYYREKFGGLSACFEGCGIRIVDLKEEPWAAQVRVYADELLDADMQQPLRLLAQQQVEKSEAALDLFFRKLCP